MNGLVVLDVAAVRENDQLWYVAHPVHPTDADVAALREAEKRAASWFPRKTERALKEIVIRDNIENAKRWLAWLIRRYPPITFVAPWIASLDGGGDDDLDPAQRARGLRDCRRTIERCDGMVHVGGRISDGMTQEAKVAKLVADLTFLGRCPPA